MDSCCYSCYVRPYCIGCITTFLTFKEDFCYYNRKIVSKIVTYLIKMSQNEVITLNQTLGRILQ